MRSILHVDMDAFYASVELLRHPELRGRPVLVGGAGPRGVVAAASYEARAYGVHSAMSSVRARRLCPQAVFLDGDHAHYAEVSERIMEVFRTFTPLVEPLSLDEAFLDVTGSRRLHGTAPEIAARVRSTIREQEGLSCSIGIATNKFVAKLASEAAKPRATPGGPVEGSGIALVEAGHELEFLHPLPVQSLWGVGPATLAKLRRLGVDTVADLASLPVEAVRSSLGPAMGDHLHALANGRDDRPVDPDLEPRSISHEETFARDVTDPTALRAEVVRQADRVADRLRRQALRARTIQIKVRYPDFTTVTRSHTLEEPTDRARDLVEEAWTMLQRLPTGRGVRLLGVGVSKLTREASDRQLVLPGVEGPTDAEPGDAGSSDGWDAAYGAVDAIRSRFGRSSIGPASTTGAADPAERPWGPAPDP